MLGLDPARIAEIPGLMTEGGPVTSSPPPLWDGKASERIADLIAGG